MEWESLKENFKKDLLAGVLEKATNDDLRNYLQGKGSEVLMEAENIKILESIKFMSWCDRETNLAGNGLTTKGER